MAKPSRLAALIRRWIRAEAGMSRLMLVTLVALLTFTAALAGGIFHATAAADEATEAHERQLVSNHLGVAMKALLSAEAVQLTWDDAVRAVGGQGGVPNLPWADTNLGQFLSSTIHVDELFLVAPDGRLLRSWSGGKPAAPSSFDPLVASVRRVLADLPANRSLSGRAASYRPLKDTHWPVDGRGRPLSRWHSGLIEFAGRPAIMTVIAIVPDVNYALLRQTPNHVVSIRYLDGAELAASSAALMLADMRFSPAQPDEAGRNHLALTTAGGHGLGYLSWRPNHVGPIVRARTVPLLAAYLAFYLVVIVLGWFMVRGAMRLSRELAASEAQAQHHALHDAMLGLPNRTYVMQRLSAMLGEVAGQRDAEGEQILLAYFDIDHFKAVNETIGHHAGDELLAQIVARLRAGMEPGDILGRLASDEFVLLRRTPRDLDHVRVDALGSWLVGMFTDPFTVFGQSVKVTTSCGISWAPEQATDAKALLRNADVALFRAKQRGRARYRRFTRDMDATIRWRQDMEIELRRAIAHDGLTMVYQPIVNVDDGSIASFEALVRWHHRERGEISPGTFVPVAEQCGLMPLLGDWVLRRVFADSQHFGGAEISVNLSPLQLVARDFLPNLKALMRAERIDPTRFTFEITEGVLLDRTSRVLGLLNELQDMGLRIALDDFGTGYSSLAYLRAFQFDRIKIDRSFVQGIETDTDAQSILRAIVSLGRILRMKVVAEGVETTLQQQLVQAAGCQLIQGHLYWRALTPPQVIALLATDRVQNLRMAV